MVRLTAAAKTSHFPSGDHAVRQSKSGTSVDLLDGPPADVHQQYLMAMIGDGDQVTSPGAGSTVRTRPQVPWISLTF